MKQKTSDLVKIIGTCLVAGPLSFGGTVAISHMMSTYIVPQGKEITINYNPQIKNPNGRSFVVSYEKR